MAIKSKLSTLMGEHRYRIQDVYERTGISRSTLSKLYHDQKVGIEFSVLDRLCELFDCTPNDILQYVKNDEIKK